MAQRQNAPAGKVLTTTNTAMEKEINKLVFGQDDDAFWRQFSIENNGTYIIGEYDNLNSVEITYLNHKIIFDNYIRYQVIGTQSFDTKFTRVRLEFKSPDELIFKLTRQGLIDSIGKLFGIQDIQINDKEFDNQFIIKGNDETKIKTIFSDQTIQNLILLQKDIQLQILYKVGIFDEPVEDGNAMLYYISETTIKQTEQLDLLLKLFKALIDVITKLNSMKPIKAYR
jgi:hypothetical protein